MNGRKNRRIDVVPRRDAPSRWDIFCSLVDNYGDVGVAWRLARQLAVDHGVAVRLFVDALAALARMAPQVDPICNEQVVQEVELHRWRGAGGEAPHAAVASVGDVVVEAFGCGLPAAYLDAMTKRPVQPVWINLEYLSAEGWIEGCHGLASRQPQLPLTRYFFFPGFTPRTGGLLRERDLIARREAFARQAAAHEALWRVLGVESPAVDALKISIFCYPDAPVEALLAAWVNGSDSIFCAVPEGVAKSALDGWVAGSSTRLERTLRRGNLTLVRVPFVAQDDYDRLLWACDVNFVRGEDSFVRAQWAARPLVWQCYPQMDAAHFAKLDAFLARYGAGLAEDASRAYAEFAGGWNGDRLLDWNRFASTLPALRVHARQWSDALASQADLASSIVKFAADRL